MECAPLARCIAWCFGHDVEDDVFSVPVGHPARPLDEYEAFDAEPPDAGVTASFRLLQLHPAAVVAQWPLKSNRCVGERPVPRFTGEHDNARDLFRPTGTRGLVAGGLHVSGLATRRSVAGGLQASGPPVEVGLTPAATDAALELDSVVQQSATVQSAQCRRGGRRASARRLVGVTSAKNERERQ